MSFRNCINDGVSSGEMSRDQADEILGLFDELEVRYNTQMGGAGASARAAGETSIAAKKIILERKRRTMLQARTWQRINLYLENYRTPGGNINKAEGAKALLEQDVSSKIKSVAQVRNAINNMATGKMNEFLFTFKRNIVGVTPKKAELKNVVRAIFGEEVDDVYAREMAEAWKSTAEWLRTRFNAAGGAIQKNNEWGMPQHHATLKVRSVSFQEWRDFILPRLDLEKMIDEQTGLPFSREKLELAFTDSHERIRTDGMVDLDPGKASGSKALANRNQDHRFFVFKDADSWMEYQEKFGTENAFDAMVGHMDTMARDIAMMEVLGPNPDLTIRFLKDTIRKDADGDAVKENAATKASYAIDVNYSAINGTINAPIDGMFANTFAGLRQVLQSAQLGSAVVAALTDPNFGRIARRMNGIPQKSQLINTLKLLNPLSAEDRKLAVRLGLIAEGWTTLASAQMRFTGDISGPEVTRRLADFTMRASFLSPWTQANRWAFGMEFLGNVADNSGKVFGELDPRMQKQFERYGVGPDKWDIMRQTPLYEHEGVSFLRAEEIEARTDIRPELARELATSLMVMIDTETNFAVPSSSIRGRTALTGDTRPGTAAGELTRSFAMYKNFGVTLFNTHIMRGVTESTKAGKGAYYADFLITTTLLGALAMQLKEISKGRDPRGMDTAEFWGAAMMQGGGFGIYGDFLFSDVNRYGGGLAGTIAGPGVGFVDDLRKLTIGNALQAMAGEDTNISSEMIGFAARYTPGSSLWYSRLALDRMVVDQLKLWADPEALKKMRRSEKKLQRETGQGYWWSKGDLTPQRSPDLSKAFE